MEEVRKVRIPVTVVGLTDLKTMCTLRVTNNGVPYKQLECVPARRLGQRHLGGVCAGVWMMGGAQALFVIDGGGQKDEVPLTF
jgi:hypothetical protein